MKTTKTSPSSSGETHVIGADGKPHSLYWTKLDAPTQPARGTLFYLAGGPISHMMYTDMAAAFQKAAYPQLDVVLYDYFGINCSTAIQDKATLEIERANLTMPAMAHDFAQLKHALVGDKKIFLMGGSHGAMLGAEIVADYPGDIEKAVLFSGDTESGWLDAGWFRFDRLMTKIDAAHPGFAKTLAQLLDSPPSGKDRSTLEVALWMAFSLSSAAQAALPELVKSSDPKWLNGIYAAALALLEPTTKTASPTEVSMVATFHRCNVWFPKSQRTPSAVPGRLFHHDAFVGYWNKLCKDYDGLGEFPLRAHPTKPVSVPILSWVGDQDTFDPDATRARWSALSSNVSFQVMEGWSHDFGPSMKTGFGRAAELIKAFVADASVAQTHQLVFGDGTCARDEDCVVGEATINCTAHDCASRARSKSRQAQWQRQLVAKCGPSVDRYPCIAAQWAPSGRAVCSEGRCAFEVTGPVVE